MMRIAITGDTHGNPRAAHELLSGEGPFDAFLHAGDFYRDAPLLAQMLEVDQWWAVTGNCDLVAPAEEKLEVELNLQGFRLLLVHGHRYRAHFTSKGVVARAFRCAADIVVYGHSHVSSIRTIGNMLVVNPGSPVRPRRGKPSVAVLELDAGTPPRAEIIKKQE